MRELRAVMAWILTSLLRPADSDAAWEERAGREHRAP
jgi:hypothetical protein